jgi:hypothetical protein
LTGKAISGAAGSPGADRDGRSLPISSPPLSSSTTKNRVLQHQMNTSTKE